MSEEQNYYTPDESDFRIGMECLSFHGGIGTYEPCIIDLLNIGNKIAANSMGDFIRVPYLTAEQIEAEGWVKQINPAYFVTERNGFKYQLTAFHDEAQAMETNCPRCHVIIRINPDPWIIDHFQVFRGTIRCINDLRLISKLLGI